MLRLVAFIAFIIGTAVLIMIIGCDMRELPRPRLCGTRIVGQVVGHQDSIRASSRDSLVEQLGV